LNVKVVGIGALGIIADKVGTVCLLFVSRRHAVTVCWDERCPITHQKQEMELRECIGLVTHSLVFVNPDDRDSGL
jgi:hypothetical protein